MFKAVEDSSREELMTPQVISIRSRKILWLICSFVVVMLLWSSQAEIDELVRGVGKVIPSKHLQLVQNLEGGILSELYISEGDRVQAGQVLLKIDDTLFESNFQESQSSLFALQAKIARLRAEVQGASALSSSLSSVISSNLSSNIHFDASLLKSSPKLIKEQRSLFERHSEQTSAAEKIVEQQIKQKQQLLAQAKFNYQQALDEKKLAQKELDILKPLLAQGVVSEVELIRAEKAVLQASGEASSNQFKVPQIEAGIQELVDKKRQIRLEFRSKAQQELNDNLAELSKISQGKGALKDRVNRTQVRSPVNGTIKQIMVNTLGGVLKPGMELVSIVPLEDALLIETKIRPADIARLYPGQKAMVKFTAYDFTVYGGLDAELVHISADSITDDQGESFYSVNVKTRKNNLGTTEQPLPIIPGMVAHVDILTGKKTLLSYLLKPILKAKQVALTER